ncbi:transmembrane 7 superfamily member 3-like [Ostrinia furnacalis]|uniref:transmembrane 7 superfamily member 3-like n=1 Tax=Ostrinia furnacalis TaxID=93504 RepID=UPI00103D92DA|nr:transmembrane 7 superfamily member 3-like [Ostrinia furnacalis]
MISQSSTWFLAITIFLLCVVKNITGEDKITIPINKTTTWPNRLLYSGFFNITRSSSVKVNFNNIDKNVSFVIFQVHSHLYDITVYNNTYVKGSYVSGTNVGLYSSVKPKMDTFYVYNQNKDVDLKVLVTLLGYRYQDPIPGGCNMEFPIPVSPFLTTKLNKDYVVVDTAPARYYSDDKCLNVVKVKVEFYMMYLPTGNYDADTYFEGIMKMMTYDNIRENANWIPLSSIAWRMRRMLSLYPGTGAVYVAVAQNSDNPNYYSVYVPTATYGCQPVDDGCELIDDVLSRFICAMLLFVGIFVCYFGHRFFKTEMFLMGMLGGFVLTYIVISTQVTLDTFALLMASIISGIFFGAFWLTFWWYYGIPVIAVSLPALNLGFLLSAIVYSQIPGPGYLPVLQDDSNFWVLFIIIMSVASLILVSLAFVSNFVCCAILGAYAIVYPIDFYLGSNIKYIIINTIRRATVPKFNLAMLNTPFQWRDGIVVALWIGLAVSGFLFQAHQNRGRPPFPPPPRSVRQERPEPSGYGAVPATIRNFVSSLSSAARRNGSDERTPLLA